MCHVHDGQTLLDLFTGYLRASWELNLHQMLILLDVVTHHAFISRYFKKFRHIHQSDTLDVDGAALLISHVITVRIHHLHLLLLRELISVHNVLHTVVLSPLDKVGEHDLH